MGSRELTITDEALPTEKNQSNCFARANGYVCVSLDYKYMQLVADVADFKIPEGGDTPVEPVLPESLYLVSDISGDWNLAGVKMDADGSVYEVTVPGRTGDVYFCFTETPGDWQSIGNARYGAEYDASKVTFGESYTVVKSDNCWTFAATAGKSYTFSFNFSDKKVTVTEVEGGDTPVDPIDPIDPEYRDLYLVGPDFGNWTKDEAYKMTREGNVYTIVLNDGIPTSEDGWKIFDGTWDYSFGAGAESPVEGTEADVWFNSTANFMTFTTGKTTVKFTLVEGSDVKDSSIASKLLVTVDGDTPVDPIDPIDPEYRDLYLVGPDFGNWTKDEAYKMTREGNVYTIVLNDGIPTSEDGWKIFDGSWDYSFGAGAESPVEGTEADVWFNSASNFMTFTTGKTTVKFTLVEGSDVKDSSIASKLLVTVDGDTPVDPTLPDALYIVGNVNGSAWATSADKVVALSKNGPVYTAKNVTIDAASEDSANGYFSFITVAGENWDAVNAGNRYGSETADAPVVAGEAAKVVLYAANVDASAATSWVAPAGVYDFTVDLSVMTVTIVASESDAIDSIEAAAVAPVYYNLQGISVAQPVSGQVYIVVRGKNVTKELMK